MTTTETVLVVGVLATPDGLGVEEWDEGWEVRRAYYHAPARNYLTRQPNTISVDVDHNGHDIGEVRYLELGDGGLIAVCECDAEAVANLDDLAHIVLSAEQEYKGGGALRTDIQVRSVALCSESATVGKAKATIIGTSLADRWNWHNKTPQRRLLERAANYHDTHRFNALDPHVIADRRGQPEFTWEPVAHRASHVADAVPDEHVNAYRRPTPTHSIPGIGPIEYSAPHWAPMIVR